MSNRDPRCPACDNEPLKPSRLEEGLKSLCCESCGGYWVKGVEYFEWLASRGARSANAELDKEPVLTEPGPDSDAGKLCLDCGRFMRRVAVGHGKTFYLDRCTHCGSFWFDSNEWASLRADGLHREAHLIFTDAWQAEVRRQAVAQADERRLTDRLGTDGLSRLREIKDWIAEHPRGVEILAALTEKTSE